jgi:hypothetical protein
LGWTKPKRKKKGYGFQTITTSHTKVTRLEHNTLLGRGLKLPYMVVNNLSTLSNVHNTNTDSISLQFWRCVDMAH